MVQFVFGGNVSFAYTVGLTPVLGYELCVTGLPAQAAHPILNMLAAVLKRGEVQDGVDLTQIANMPCRLLTQPAGKLQMGVASSLGYHPPTIRQLIWPDQQGHFPDDPAYTHPWKQNLDEIETNADEPTRH
jgi:hypothetical protein